jgi:glyoxylase-like metal-dependent hydrolase (beta-lactamase superfamily II)/rhodanese-related sulfurtransferase
VLFTQFLDDDLGCASYLVGDEDAGVAVLVDPPLAVEPLLEEAARRGVTVVKTLETHTHADHVSGHGRLALELGIPIAINPAAAPDYQFEPLEDGARVELGVVVLTAVHTPGHRPEHTAFTVADTARSDEPWLVLTGDSLFVGDAARPDLAVEPREGAEVLYRSLHRLVDLGDGVEVFPGHVAGSMCGRSMSSKGSTTIGFERRFNPMLRLDGLEDFVAESVGTAGLRPPNVERIVALNRGPFVGAPSPLDHLEAPPARATVLDVRPSDEFAAGHVPGALHVPIDGSSFGTRAAFVLPADAPVLLHASDEDEARLAARRLHAVGFMDLAGWSIPGADGASGSEPLTPLAHVSIEELERLVEADSVQVLDVREADERDDGYIPGSRHVPYRLVGAFAGSIGEGKPVVTICESGARAAVAASVLAAHGVEARAVLDGGMPDWPGQTTHFRRCGS